MIAFYPTLGDTEKDSFVLMDSCQMFRMHSDETNNAFYSLVRDYDLEWNKSIDMNLVLRKEDDADTLYGNILLHKVIDVEYVLYSILSIIIDKRLVNENYLASSVFQPMQNIMCANSDKNVYLSFNGENKCTQSTIPNQLAKDIASYLFEDFTITENTP